MRIIPLDPDWSPSELGMLRQSHLFIDPPKEQLEKIPYKFVYTFRSDEAHSHGHNHMSTDWEKSQSSRSWKAKYGDRWQEAFRQTYESKMINKNDTHFFVGSVASHPNKFIIIGLLYPPRDAASQQSELF